MNANLTVNNRANGAARSIRPLTIITLCAFSLSLAATAGPGLAWPPPPARSRLAYVARISSPAEAGVKPSTWARLGALLTGQSAETSPFDRPFGLGLDEADNLCMTDTGANAVYFLDFANKRFHRWNGIDGAAFQSPVAVAKRKDVIYVADSAAGAVLAFNLSGKRLFTVTQQVERPSGVAVSDNNLFVVDSALHRVAVFDLAGNYLRHFGKRGTGPGEFNYPTHVALDGKGRVLVTDSMNARIEVFDEAGRFARVIGGPGDSTGYFTRPKGVAADAAGRVYAVDAMSDNFQIFDGEGRVLLDVGSTGSGTGEFWLPSGIAIGRNGRIYVADSSNHRVQVFQLLQSP